MSNYIEYTDEQREIWIIHIKNLLDILYKNGNLILLGLILQQVYEYSVWFVQNSNGKPFKLKDLHCINNSIDFIDMCSTLYKIRGYATHSAFYLNDNKSIISDLLQSQCFKELLEYTFPDTSIFDEMLNTYSRWLYA